MKYADLADLLGHPGECPVVVLDLEVLPNKQENKKERDRLVEAQLSCACDLSGNSATPVGR